MQRVLLSVGHGYSARHFARQRIAEGWHVIGTTRSAEKAEILRQEGVEPLIWPDADLAPALARATHLLTSVAPDGEGDPLLRLAGPQIATARHLSWIGYLSTTGVYGDHRGGWVDEDAPLTPSTRRGRARVAAEAEWRALCTEAGLPLHIFRLAGIYGPGRGPFEKIRRGTAQRVIKADQVFSRIHIEDIARTLAASIAHPAPGTAYNVCDDNPAPPQEVLAYAADMLGLPRPPEVDFETAEMSPMARSFYADSKRVRNDRIKRDLGVRLAYPDYPEGLAAVLAAEAAEAAEAG